MAFDTQVCIVGAGPAGAFLALCLASRGVRVTLLERAVGGKREFRGETLSPAVLALLDRYGLSARLREHRPLEVRGMEMWDAGRRIFHADYEKLESPYKFPVDLPQPLVIDALIAAARLYPNFEFRPGVAYRELIVEGGTVRGARIEAREGKAVSDLRANLVVAADGRYSAVLRDAGLPVERFPADRDFLWFKTPIPPGFGNVVRLKLQKDSHVAVLPTFPDLLRVGMNIPKGGFARYRAQGIESFRAAVAALEPALEPYLAEHVQSFSDLTVLDIFTSIVPQWSRDGLVLVGDAAHTMSPVLGQGVNLAMQDAVVLAGPVFRQLQAHPDETVPRSALLGYEKARQKRVRFVRKFQLAQEEALMRGSLLGVTARQLKMSVLDRLPLKYRFLTHLMCEVPADG